MEIQTNQTRASASALAAELRAREIPPAARTAESLRCKHTKHQRKQYDSATAAWSTPATNTAHPCASLFARQTRSSRAARDPHDRCTEIGCCLAGAQSRRYAPARSPP